MPLAGVLSMLLSLGGSIVPNQASEYATQTANFPCGGLIATQGEAEREEIDEINDMPGTEAEEFAATVERRSKDHRSGGKYWSVRFGMIVQCFWLAVLLSACWFTQTGVRRLPV